MRFYELSYVSAEGELIREWYAAKRAAERAERRVQRRHWRELARPVLSTVTPVVFNGTRKEMVLAALYRGNGRTYAAAAQIPPPPRSDPRQLSLLPAKTADSEGRSANQGADPTN